MDFSLIAHVAAGVWLAGILAAWACTIFGALHPSNKGKLTTLPGFVFVFLLAIPLWPMAIAAVLNELFMEFHPLMAKDDG
jgi:hypothetical protein